MPPVAASETCSLLQSCSNDSVARLAKDAELVTALTAVLNASLEIAAEFPETKGQLALAVAKKGLAVSHVGAVTSQSRSLEMANLAAGQTLKSLGLVKVAGFTPAKASMYITLTMAEKVVSAAGVANLDKCRMAIASLALSTGAGGFVCVGSLGIACIAGAIAVAADAFNVYGQCTTAEAGRSVTFSSAAAVGP